MSHILLFIAPNSPPEDLTAATLSSTVLHLIWSAPSTKNRNGIIREYHVNITEVDTTTFLSYTTATTSITVQSLHPFYTYWCTVSAFTVARGPFSEIVTVLMPEDGMLTLKHIDINVC